MTVAPRYGLKIQAELMRKSNPRRVVCLLDGDEAGQAPYRMYPYFLKLGWMPISKSFPRAQILIKY